MDDLAVEELTDAVTELLTDAELAQLIAIVEKAPTQFLEKLKNYYAANYTED